jgi:hypothetical protein
VWLLQAPKPQASKEAKALAASNSSKGKKKVAPCNAFAVSVSRVACLSLPTNLGVCIVCMTSIEDSLLWLMLKPVVVRTEMVKGKNEGESQQSSAPGSGRFPFGA